MTAPAPAASPESALRRSIGTFALMLTSVTAAEWIAFAVGLAVAAAIFAVRHTR